MKPVSPWAEVQPEETLPTLAPPASASSVWAEPQGVDLHAGLKPIAAPAPQPSHAMGKLPAAMEPQTDPIAMQPQTDPVAMPAQKAEAPQTIKSRLNSKLERDYEKDANPWGSPDNHPGFFGKLAHALNHATGGDTRRQWEENGLVHQINTQQAAEDQSAEKTAQTARTTQQTASQPDKDAMDAAYKKAQTENLESETAVRNEPDLARAYAHAVNQAVLKGQDPAQDPIVQHLSDAITGKTKSKGLQYQTAVGPDGKPHVYGLDEQGNKVADIGQHYEKPMTVNVGNVPGTDNIDALVTAIGEGRAPLPNPRTAQGSKILAAVTAKYPNFDGSTFSTQEGTRHSSTYGKLGTTINSLNTINEHLDSAEKNMPQNGNYHMLNMVENAASTAVGGNPTGKYAIDADAIAGEWSKMVSGGVATEGELNHIKKLLDPNASPTQMQQNLAEVRSLTEGKLHGIQKQVESGALPNGTPTRGISSLPQSGKEIHYKIVNGKLVAQ